jgi:hypothetical protein
VPCDGPQCVAGTLCPVVSAGSPFYLVHVSATERGRKKRRAGSPQKAMIQRLHLALPSALPSQYCWDPWLYLAIMEPCTQMKLRMGGGITKGKRRHSRPGQQAALLGSNGHFLEGLGPCDSVGQCILWPWIQSPAPKKPPKNKV